jgi:formylglycine-generating enzyme
MPAAQPQLRNMTPIPGGEFRMGSADFYAEERPVHRVTVDGFWIDTRPVTVEEFRRFAKATAYVTVAERPLDPADDPDADTATSHLGFRCVVRGQNKIPRDG